MEKEINRNLEKFAEYRIKYLHELILIYNEHKQSTQGEKRSNTVAKNPLICSDILIIWSFTATGYSRITLPDTTDTDK